MNGMYSDLSIVWWLVPVALLMGLGFLWVFIRAAQSGQYEDLETPAVRILLENKQGENDETGSAE